MIDLHGVISMPFLKKSRFTGSYRGMRYVLRKQDVYKRQDNVKMLLFLAENHGYFN